MKRKKWIKHSKVLGDFAHVGGGNPCADWPLNFIGGICPRPNHVFQIWWRSVQGFSVGWGSHFAILHYFDGRPYDTLRLQCERMIGNGKIWPSAYAKPLNRSSPNLKHVITSGIASFKILGLIRPGVFAPLTRNIHPKPSLFLTASEPLQTSSLNRFSRLWRHLMQFWAR